MTTPKHTRQSASYHELVRLFTDFRAFQEPPEEDGVHDYSPGTMREQLKRLPKYRARLEAIGTAGWSVPELADRDVVRAEMNGMQFDHEVLRPWERDPSFFSVVEASETDVPEREGPRMHGTLCLWTCTFPLGRQALAHVRAKLEAIPAILTHARCTIVATTKDLHFLAIGQKRHESRVLGSLARRMASMHPELVKPAHKAGAAVEQFIGWLERRHGSMPESRDGIGTDEFDWSMKHVHLVPWSWEQQKEIITRELERSWSLLALEEHRNRHLPKLNPPGTIGEWQVRVAKGRADFMSFIRSHDIFTVPDYMEFPGGVPQKLVPAKKRDIFTQVQYHNLLPFNCHMVHWLEKQREARTKRPIRGMSLLYNIWDSRAEGFATAFEETMMHAGMLDAEPRARELVYVLLAFRAARALGDLMMHSRHWSFNEAVDFASANTPRGWVLPRGETAVADLGLYLRQPGYGTSYVVGKTQFDQLMAECMMKRGSTFNLKRFFDGYFACGMIPASLIRKEMAG